MTLGDRLSKTAKDYPKRVALTFEGRKLNFRELDTLADGFAAGLESIGIGRGDRVGILLPNSVEFVVAFFGVQKAGAAAVPLNTFLTAHELTFILNDSGCKALVLSAEFNDKVEPLIKGTAGTLKLVCAHGDIPGAAPFDALVKRGGKGAGAVSDTAPASIVYTSGTTGYPKGAVLTHVNLLSNALSAAAAFKVTRRDRFLLFLPMFHSFSLLVCIILPVAVGARIIALKSVRPFSNVVKGVLFGRATFFVAIPAVYNLLSMKKFPRLILWLLPLRLCVSGAAPLPADTLDRFAKNYPFPLLEGYGLTETSPVVSCNPLDGVRKPGSVGIPIPGVEVKIVDDEERELTKGEVGEIIVKGPNVMRGYLNNEQATKEAIRGGWLFTGDMGRLDKDGYLYIVDRKNDLILVRGMNVYPREIEEAIYSHPKVKDAAVVGVDDPAHGGTAKAFVTVRDGETLTERELKEYLKSRLASYKLPRQYEFRESLPMTPTGKVLKRELKAGG